MFQSYFKVGLRNLLHHKGHSLINITGLAAGVTCCLFIALYINDELSYDRYHTNGDRIYRVSADTWAKLPPAFAPALKGTYPHISEQVVRFWPLFAPAKVRHGDVVFVEQGGMFTDPSVFEVFSWPMLSGDATTALTDANAIVLTRSMSKKYFGEVDPIGKPLTFWGQDMTVTGIMEDVPSNSHLRFDFLVSFQTLFSVMGKDVNENWGLPAFYTYVLSPQGTSVDDITRAAGELFKLHDLAPNAGPWVLPIDRIHLHSNLESDFLPGGNVLYLYTLATAAFIVLLLACINFTNLATARAATRTKEVGIRKVMGAMRSQLIGQFFGEALMMSIAAFIIAIMVVNPTLPLFNAIAGKSIEADALSEPLIASALAIIMLLIGLVAGAYPALYLSQFKPVAVLKGAGHLRLSGLLLRKGLIVFQFTLSTVFLISIAAVLLQLRYLQSKDLGFDKEQIVVLDGDNFPQMRDALRGVAGVEHVSGVPRVLGGHLPGSNYRAEGVITDSLTFMKHFGVTEQFLETMGIDLLAGRSFIEGSASDDQNAFILNESALRVLGWTSADDAIGKTFAMAVPPMEGGMDTWREGKIVGVIEDFHYDALYQRIEPLALHRSNDLNLTFVRVREPSQDVIAGIRNVWRRVNPDAPFNYYFLNDHLARKYESEEKLGSFMGAATALAVLIACLGLLGLVSFSAAQRTKEIGIRKVLGATAGQRVTLLTSDYLRLVCIAIVVAIPLAYATVEQWLSNFAYHTDISWLIFAVACGVALLVATMTVSYQAMRAADADPAASIRHE